MIKRKPKCWCFVRQPDVVCHLAVFGIYCNMSLNRSIRKTYVLSRICKVDKKAMLRNRYNRIPHPTPNTKRERDTHNQNGTKTRKQHKRKAKGTFSPTDDHKATPNKPNSKKVNRKFQEEPQAEAAANPRHQEEEKK